MNKKHYIFVKIKIPASGKTFSNVYDTICFQNTNPVYILAWNKICSTALL